MTIRGILAFAVAVSACSATSVSEPRGTDTSRLLRARPPAPHREIVGPRAEAVYVALADVMGEKPAGYDLAALSCVDVSLADRRFFTCQASPRADGAPQADVAVRDSPSSGLAERLFVALHEAGAQYDLEKMTRVRLRNVKANRTSLTFDDLANYRPLPPNIELDGRAGAKIIDALAAAGLADDREGSLSVSCTMDDGKIPACASYLRGSDGPTPLAPARSAEMWRTLLEGARLTGRRVELGCTASGCPLEEAEILTARQFTYDGKTLRFVLQIEKRIRPASQVAPPR